MSDRGARLRTGLALGAVLLVAACGAADSAPGRLIIASTTSTEDSGLFEVLIPAFEAAHPGIDAVVIAVGSGEALALGRHGDADVLLVHSPAAESAFVAEGYGVDRRPVMYNDFVVVGPAADPAGIRGSRDAVRSLARIAEAGAPFVSRGDGSGTHARERALWRAAGIDPDGSWYREAGQGMGDVLRIASEAGAYTLTDRGTYLFLRDRLALEVLVEGDARLRNDYSVILVDRAANPLAAAAFHAWIRGPAAQALIEGYGADRFGRPLFAPNATPSDP
ncbi:MAG TPA: substrate-binding domain-containing protein [Longimicrobiales bacterium]